MGISHSNATGVVEAKPFYMQQSWGKGMDEHLTAAKVIEAAWEQAEDCIDRRSAAPISPPPSGLRLEYYTKIYLVSPFSPWCGLKPGG
jgi:hypothetical protein